MDAWNSFDDRWTAGYTAEYLDGMHFTDYVCEVEALIRIDDYVGALGLLRDVVKRLADRSDLTGQHIPFWWIATGACVARKLSDYETELWFHDMSRLAAAERPPAPPRLADHDITHP
ncbi:hypothetical protein ONR57_20010 [Hoyosella sp. YIM 151337]|uniref:hypothetical protein n=1 Tax=Hoyosella sp. YIM 151337 TaxID=2992742 RepID=UPI00223568D2|nr:hypothetical protein [Hoyosella sp. YIM 151337]MCW4355594.1 hypothetical protein [Hoyosella sp. YIM 151337]